MASDIATNLRDLIASGADLEAIEAHLDALDPSARLAQTTFLGRREQRRLFDIAGKKPLRIGDVVPSDVGAMREVVHFGKNSLPLFTRFAKVFCRPETAEKEGELWGYNRTNGLLSTTVGPGYYVAYDRGDNEVLIDYLRLPPRHPTGWPEIAPNSSRLSYFVYHGMQDVLRRVSRHVSIGRAMKKEKWMDAWFILCREGP